VVDNGSDDGTAEGLRELEPSLGVPHRFIYNASNYGNSRARNQIIDHALHVAADYLLFVDSDIEIVPHSVHAMLRYLESCGRFVGCVGAFSHGFSDERAHTTPSLFSLADVQLGTLNFVAWTQYGLFRADVFRDGVRFDEAPPFDGAGWGFEDNDLAFQMDLLGYRLHHFTGMTYLHRKARSSIRIMRRSGIDPAVLFKDRRTRIIEKWSAVEQIARGPLIEVERIARAPSRRCACGGACAACSGKKPAAEPPRAAPQPVAQHDFAQIRVAPARTATADIPSLDGIDDVTTVDQPRAPAAPPAAPARAPAAPPSATPASDSCSQPLSMTKVVNGAFQGGLKLDDYYPELVGSQAWGASGTAGPFDTGTWVGASAQLFGTIPSLCFDPSRFSLAQTVTYVKKVINGVRDPNEGVVQDDIAASRRDATRKPFRQEFLGDGFWVRVSMADPPSTRHMAGHNVELDRNFTTSLIGPGGRKSVDWSTSIRVVNGVVTRNTIS
jgi:hypothetical protein